MLLTLLTPTFSLATTCQQALQINHEALNSCLAVVQDKNKALEASELSVSERDKMLTETRTALVEEQSKNQAIWRNPFVLIGLGVIGGLLIKR